MRLRTLAVGLLCTSIPLTGCSGGSDGSSGKASATSPRPAASSASSSAAAPSLPTGYRQIGGPKNGFTVGVPGSWADIDLASATATADFKKAGIDPKVADQAIRTLSRNNAVYAADPKTARTEHFASNLNGFCAAGQPASADAIKAQFQQIGARNITVENVTLNGRAALKVTYTHPVGGADTVGLQYQVAGSAGKTCFVTMTAKKGIANPFDTIATTIHPF